MTLFIALVIALMMINPLGATPAQAEDLDRSAPGPVTFHYEDNDFEQVYLTGSFTDWVRIPLDLEDDTWTLTYWAPEGRHYYRFVVMEGHDTWEAIDPNNSSAIKHREHGWVSVVEIDEDDAGGLVAEDTLEKETSRSHRKQIRKELKRGQVFSGDIFYQRVDGLILGLATSHTNIKGTFEPSARVYGNYGFSSGRFGGGLTILQPLIPSHTLNLKLAVFECTMANSNSTGIGTLENSLAAFFLHEDYFDYHRAKGVNASLVFKIGQWLRLEGGARTEEQSTVGDRSVWSMKQGDFLPNPAIDNGSLRSLFANLEVGGAYNHLRAEYERCGEEIFGGDFGFERISAQLRGRLKLGPNAGFDVRVAGGSNFRGHLPVQKRFLLGGLGTVRGYAYQSLLIEDPDRVPVPGETIHGGERSVLGNAEYFFHVDDWLGVALFYDAGMVWENRDAEPTWDALKTSTGLGVNFGSHDDCRIDMIQRLDDRSKPVVFQFRLKRGF